MVSNDTKADKYWGKLSSPQYWLKRSEELDKAVIKLQKRVYKEMAQAYAETFREIAKETNDFLMKYADDNKIDLATVNQLITPVDLAHYNEKIEELRAMYRDTNSEYILREIKELEARMTITRLQALQDTINIELCKVSHEFQMTLEDTLIGLFTDQYKEVSQLLGVMNPVIPTEAVKKIIEYPYHGKMFADSIWYNKKRLLVEHIERNLTIGIIRGDSIQKMSKQLKKDLEVLYYQAERLIRTETNYVMNQGHLQGYKDSEMVEKYEFLAAIDSRTSKLCRNQNQKVYKLSDAKVGVNFPPLHPNCRSTAVPVIENW